MKKTIKSILIVVLIIALVFLGSFSIDKYKENVSEKFYKKLEEAADKYIHTEPDFEEFLNSKEGSVTLITSKELVQNDYLDANIKTTSKYKSVNDYYVKAIIVGKDKIKYEIVG